MGIENELSSSEIDQADLVIIGADVGIEGMERFDGKLVYRTAVSDCVTNPHNVFEHAMKLVEN